MIKYFFFFFFFNDTATTEIYTLSLHDALPISTRPATATSPSRPCSWPDSTASSGASTRATRSTRTSTRSRSEEHTSELQSRSDLVCRLLLEKKKKNIRRLMVENTTNTHSLQVT